MGWCFAGTDKTSYHGDEPTKEAAIQEAICYHSFGEGDKASIAQTKPFTPSLNIYDMIDTLVCQASDEAGEVGEEWGIQHLTEKDPEYVELEKSLQTVFNAWLLKHDYWPKFYGVQDEGIVVVTKEMLGV
jgi:hypothetical protein